MSDQELRRQAVERAYRNHADDVYRLALAILHEPEEAIDATHESFARAFERWEQYDNARPLRAWLHGIASHVALDLLRRRRVQLLARPALGRVFESMGSSSDGQGDPAVRLAQRDLVEGVLGGLKGDARAALVLRHYYGYDYAEIAGFLRTTPGNVGSILSRAHDSIRNRLAIDDRDIPDDGAAERRAAR